MGRKQYVDYIKAIGIVLVVLGHINFANEAIKNWIYSFHMPLFFFATGLTIRRKEISKKLLKSKIESLIVPYFIWGLIYAGYTLDNLGKLVYGSYYSITSSGSLTSLWFLPTMFIAVLLVYGILWKREDGLWLRAGVMVIIIFSLIVPEVDIGYPWCIDVALLAVVFILFGYLFEKDFNKMISRWQQKYYLIFIGLGFVMTLTNKMNTINLGSYILMANRRIGNPVCFFVAAIGGCIMIYGVAQLIQYNVKSRLLTYIGTNTLTIFAVQKPIIAVFEKCFEILRIPAFFELIITTSGTLAISCVFCLIINRFVPCLAGGHGQRK